MQLVMWHISLILLWHLETFIRQDTTAMIVAIESAGTPLIRVNK